MPSLEELVGEREAELLPTLQSVFMESRYIRTCPESHSAIRCRATGQSPDSGFSLG